MENRYIEVGVALDIILNVITDLNLDGKLNGNDKAEIITNACKDAFSDYDLSVLEMTKVIDEIRKERWYEND